jgi:AraC family transcriptional regulator
MSRMEFDPPSLNLPTLQWQAGAFDSGQRPLTRKVRGELQLSEHLLMVTLSGFAEDLQVATDQDHRYTGQERAGAVSFVPAGTCRSIQMRNAALSWACIRLDPSYLSAGGHCLPLPAFTNLNDSFLHASLAEMTRLHQQGRLSPGYCDALSLAISHYLQERHFADAIQASRLAMPMWRIRRVHEFIEANLDKDLSVAALAVHAGLSVGHFHRAYRAATSKSPLSYVQERRIEAALRALSGGHASIAQVALQVGFANASHFARVFRRRVGMSPAEFAAFK